MSVNKPVWAIVPARGGSKSIPLKNLVPVAGRPLLDYGVRAVQASGRCDRVIGSTDDQRIADRFTALGAEVDMRPADLGQDDTPVLDVVRDMVNRLAKDGVLPEVVVLVQPTSPFLLPEHCAALIDRLLAEPTALSAQTIVHCPHNHHAWNQRKVEKGIVSFVYEEERRRAYNKQTKPEHFVFGNLLATRTTAVMAGQGLFAAPSLAIEIEPPYEFDLDGPRDLAVAEALITNNCVTLTHML